MNEGVYILIAIALLGLFGWQALKYLNQSIVQKKIIHHHFTKYATLNDIRSVVKQHGIYVLDPSFDAAKPLFDQIKRSPSYQSNILYYKDLVSKGKIEVELDNKVVIIHLDNSLVDLI